MYSLEYNYITPLKYGKADSKNYKAAIEHYNELAMRRNFFVDDAKKSFNPLSAVQNLFSIPSRFLEWIGFNLSEFIFQNMEHCCNRRSFFLGMYHNEIKSCFRSPGESFIPALLSQLDTKEKISYLSRTLSCYCRSPELLPQARNSITM